MKDLEEKEYYDFTEILKKSFDYSDKLLFYGGFKIIYETSNDFGYFLYNNNEMIGICIINCNNNIETERIKYILLNYAIKEEYRDLKYGSKFFNYIIDDLEYLINEVYLDVDIENKKAYNIYKKNGFKEIKNGNEESKEENNLIEMKRIFKNIQKRRFCNIFKNIERIEINLNLFDEVKNLSNEKLDSDSDIEEDSDKELEDLLNQLNTL